ncbi:MAG: ribosome small subunit-dependent GTPase A [Methylophilaceae bacterium]|jgi:ribosome biogenesis GTPase|nr:ribosome small subunit-dependent GTPase A [Methylophilaceae bacterium]MDG1453704.1 ribosome small subunit-dependent GTPase A [Methylophilaceae bacterium]
MLPLTSTNNIINLNNKLQTLQGLVVAAYGKRYQVELPDKKRISCVTRGKKTNLACGDIVNIKLTDRAEGVVESNEPRNSLLYRSNAFKSKILASNVTQVVIVLATQPSFYEALLNRCLAAAEAANIKPLIVLNKCDLAETNDAKNKLKVYEDLGYEIVYLSAKTDINPLSPYLSHQQSVLVGQSGMGKSTIINALLPNESVRTQEISNTLDSGKHTTTATHLYYLDANSTLIDSPGLQEFGLNHLTQEDLELSFIEFKPYLGHCRFNNCKHQVEPGCAVKQAVNEGKINPVRMAFYTELSQELLSN